MCNCSNNSSPCSQSTPCSQPSCACPVFISTDCVDNLTEDLPCSGISKGQTLTEVLKQLDTFICNKFDLMKSFFKLKNIGTGARIYAGDALTGEKNLRTVSSTTSITVAENTSDISIRVSDSYDANVLHRTSNESFTGTKSSTTNGDTILNLANSGSGFGVYIVNSGTGTGSKVYNAGIGTGLDVENVASGDAISVTNSDEGVGIRVTNNNDAVGIEISSNSTNSVGMNILSTSTDNALYIDNTGTGTGMAIDSSNGSAISISNASTNAANAAIEINNTNLATAKPIRYYQNGLEKFSVNTLGDTTANKFIKSGGTNLQYLMADGSVSTSTSSPTYRVYTAKVNQTGSGIPVSTVLENTTGATFTWTRSGAGGYALTASSSIFSSGTPVLNMSLNYVGSYTIGSNFVGSIASASACLFQSTNATTLIDDIIKDAFLEIRIYP